MPKSLPLLPIGPPKWSRPFIRVLDSHSHPLLLTSLIISVLRKHRLVIRNPEWAYHTHAHTHMRTAAFRKVVWWKKKRGREQRARQRKVRRLMKIIFHNSCKLLALASFWHRPSRPPPLLMSLFQGVWRTINFGLLESLQQILRQSRITEFPHNPSLKRSPPLWLASQPCAFFWPVMLGRSCRWKGFVLWSMGGANRCCCFRVCFYVPSHSLRRLEFRTQVTHCIRQTVSWDDFCFFVIFT